jgi:hypothetical protein
MMTVPAGLATVRQVSTVAEKPAQSMHTSAPRPFVSFITSAAKSASLVLKAMAPSSRALSRRLSSTSPTMI